MNKIQLVCVDKITNPSLITDVIYNNFAYLSKFPELMHDKQSIKSSMAKDGFNYLVYHITDKPKLIAYLIGEYKHLPDNRFVYYISYFYVMEKYRSKKIGGTIMKDLIKKCRETGIKFIVLTCDTVDERAVNFYKKHGFIVDPILGKDNKRHNVFALFLE